MGFPTAVSGLVLILATTTALHGQSARSGFWMSAGAGYASAALDCVTCNVDRETGTGLLLRIGNSPDPRVSIGGEITAFSMRKNANEISSLSIMGVALAYPIDSAGLFFSGGVGLFKVEYDYPAAPQGLRNVENRATGIQLGGGYDIPLLRGLFLTPYALYVKAIAGGTTSYEGSTIDEEISPSYYQFGIGLTWH